MVDLVGRTSTAVARAQSGLPDGMLRREWIGRELHDTTWVLAQEPDLILIDRLRDAPGLSTEVRSQYYATWLLVQAIEQGMGDYALLTPQIKPGQFAQLFMRRQLLGR